MAATRVIVRESDRLRLRELTPEDAPRLLALYRQPRIADALGPPPASLAVERANIDRHRTEYYARHGVGLWGIELKDGGAFIGRAGLLPREIDGRPEVEVSYVLDPAHWGRGYATEAARAAVAVAAERLRTEHVIALIVPANARSIRVAERLGMSFARSVDFAGVGLVRLYAGSVRTILRPASAP